MSKSVSSKLTIGIYRYQKKSERQLYEYQSVLQAAEAQTKATSAGRDQEALRRSAEPLLLKYLTEFHQYFFVFAWESFVAYLQDIIFLIEIHESGVFDVAPDCEEQDVDEWNILNCQDMQTEKLEWDSHVFSAEMQKVLKQLARMPFAKLRKRLKRLGIWPDTSGQVGFAIEDIRTRRNRIVHSQSVLARVLFSGNVRDIDYPEGKSPITIDGPLDVSEMRLRDAWGLLGRIVAQVDCNAIHTYELLESRVDVIGRPESHGVRW